MKNVCVSYESIEWLLFQVLYIGGIPILFITIMFVEYPVYVTEQKPFVWTMRISDCIDKSMMILISMSTYPEYWITL